jgi:hypothetical protein
MCSTGLPGTSALTLSGFRGVLTLDLDWGAAPRS